MLVLERKPGQRIIINGNIQIIYSSCDYRTGKIKIGIEAPKDVIIDREEIHQRKLDEAIKNANA
jgi:carbon storage regulator